VWVERLRANDIVMSLALVCVAAVRLGVGAAVYGKVGAGDIGGLRAGYEGNQSGDFIDVAVAAE